MKEINIIKEKTCALTGHRKVEKDFEVDVLQAIFIKLIDSGINTFLCGMAVGFDTLAFKVLHNLKKEKDLKDKIEQLMFSYGADGVAFDTIVAFGANGAVPHHETGDTILQDNMPILVDVGCTYNGYCSDLTRMAYYGTPNQEFLTYPR